MPKVSPEAELANHCMQQTTRQELHILLGRVAGRVAADATALARHGYGGPRASAALRCLG